MLRFVTDGRPWKRRSCVVAGGLAFLAAVPDVASAADRLGGHTLDVALETDFPTRVGAGVSWETPGRARMKLGLGVMPGPYVDVTNAAMVGFDIYSDDVGSIIDSALERTVVLQLQGGYRPLESRGFYVLGGYQFWGLGGSTTELNAFSETMDANLYQAAQSVTGDIQVGIASHMLVGTAGWEWPLENNVVLGASLGFAYTLAAPSRAAPTRTANNEVEQEVMDGVTASAEDYLTYVFEEWVHLPFVCLSVGYRFR